MSEKNGVRSRMLSTRQAAEYCGLAVRTLWNRSGRGAKKPFPVKARRYGNKLLWDIKELDNFLDGLPSG